MRDWTLQLLRSCENEHYPPKANAHQTYLVSADHYKQSILWISLLISNRTPDAVKMLQPSIADGATEKRKVYAVGRHNGSLCLKRQPGIAGLCHTD